MWKTTADSRQISLWLSFTTLCAACQQTAHTKQGSKTSGRALSQLSNVQKLTVNSGGNLTGSSLTRDKQLAGLKVSYVYTSCEDSYFPVWSCLFYFVPWRLILNPKHFRIIWRTSKCQCLALVPKAGDLIGLVESNVHARDVGYGAGFHRVC